MEVEHLPSFDMCVPKFLRNLKTQFVWKISVELKMVNAPKMRKMWNKKATD